MSSGAEDAYEDAVDAPPSKRPRILSKACESCQVKKSKCDSARPACGPCRLKGISCNYRQRAQPGLPRGYGKAVDHRLSSLEENIERINKTLEAVLQQVGHSDNTSQQSTAEPILCENPQAREETRQPIQMPAISSASPANIRQPDSHSNYRSENELPPDAIIAQLVDLFFEKVYTWAPIFYRPHFAANMKSPERRILLHGIVVVAFRYWKHPEPPLQTREEYIQASRDKILLETIDTCSLISTQALSLLAIDAIGQGPSPRTWKVMSMLYTASQELGLERTHSPVDIEVDTPLVRNEDLNDDLDLSIVEGEEKHRLFWLIYRLDQYSSVSRGRSGTMNANDIHLPYPVGEDEWGLPIATKWFEAMPQPRSTAIHASGNVLWHCYIDVMVFLDRTNQLLVKPVNLSLPANCQEWQSNFRRLDTTVSSWFENLPVEVRDRPAQFDPVWMILHATFYLIKIRMYTVASFPSTSSPYLKPSSSARGLCRQSVKNVASLATSVQPHELDQLSPMFAFVVWVASRSLIILWTSGYESSYVTMPADLELLLWILRQMGSYWSSAQRYVDIIQLILDTKNNPGGPTGLDIFNDTRRTAYGVQNRLGKLAVNRAYQGLANSFDFLDIPLLDTADFGFGRTSSLGFDMVDEWL
ncbi:fungal-specific transcription factor domain-containing protein [Nemania sp. FL0916]|nr:fungal-specific transcription factor domain-containing protein [Nemania sp. FL0916]